MADVKWTSCCEKLPSEHKQYLVTTSLGTVMIATFYPHSVCSPKWSHRHLKMIAWAELPEPYKGSELGG